MKLLKPFAFSVLLLCVATFSYSALPASLPLKTIQSKPATANLQQLKNFTQLTPKQYGLIRGKKLSFVERLQFKAAQKKARFYSFDEGTSGFNVGGFFLGFFLGGLGVIGAYIFSRDRNFRKWTWYGWLSWIAIILIIFATVGTGVR